MCDVPVDLRFLAVCFLCECAMNTHVLQPQAQSNSMLARSSWPLPPPKIEAAEMLFDLEIGRAVFRRPLVRKHRAAEMVAAVQPLEAVRAMSASRRAIICCTR
jgi:hypothetical protein